MKSFKLLIVFFFLFACQFDKKDTSKIREHNPKNEITQVLQNKNAIALYSKASEFMGNSEFDSAKVYLKKSLEYEKSPIIYNELGITELAQKNFSKAIYFQHMSIDTDTTYYPSYINLSRCYISINEFEKGKDLLNKMIKNCNSDYWKAYGNMYLALIYFNGFRDCEKAKELLEKAAILKDDKDLRQQYIHFFDSVNKTCR